jgi:S1-C subfamily serine protease
MKHGEILQRGWLGVQLSTSHLGPGAKITSTPKEGAAADAGLRKGDVIVAVDGMQVMNGPHFQMLVSSRLGGDSVTVTWLDDGKGDPITKVIELRDAPWSAQLQSKTAELPPSFPVPEGGEGR